MSQINRLKVQHTGCYDCNKSMLIRSGTFCLGFDSLAHATALWMVRQVVILDELLLTACICDHQLLLMIGWVSESSG